MLPMRQRFAGLKAWLTKIKLQFNKLRAKLVVYYFAFILIPISVVLFFVLNAAVGIMKDEVLGYVLNTLDQASKNVDEVVERLMNQTTRVCIDDRLEAILMRTGDKTPEEIIAFDDEISDIITFYMGDTPNIESFYIFGYDQSVYRMKGADSSLKQDYTFTSADWYKRMRKLGLASMLLPSQRQTDVLSVSPPKNVISYISEVRHPNSGSVIGYARANVDQRIFNAQLGDINLIGNSKLVIMDNNKTIIFHSEPEYVSTQLRADYIGDVFQRGKGSLIADEDGTETIVAFTTSQTTGWTMLYTVPADTIYEKINSVNVALLYILGIGVPAAIWIAAVVSGGYLRSLSVLRNHMKLAEKGEFGTKVDISAGGEIGELAASFNHMMERIKQLIEQVYQTEINRKAAELGALQAQINPHFLYNTLQIIDIMAEEKDAGEISQACQALSKVFRYSIRKVEKVSVKDELTHVENYIFIQKLRFGDRLNVTYKVAPETLKMETLKLVIQPLVENSIMHGTENSVVKCDLTISVSLLQDKLSISVDDTGIGMDEREVERVQAQINSQEPLSGAADGESGGIALRNVNQRLKLRYGEQYGLFIRSRKFKGTQVLIIMPAYKYLRGDG